VAGLIAATRNTMGAAFTDLVTHVSLHTDDPGATGTDEATGGSPAYARKAITWAAWSAGASSNTGALVFDVPTGTYNHVGYWSADTGGTYYGSRACTSQTFSGQGTYTIAIGDLDETVT
jgi:hypothetical protein